MLFCYLFALKLNCRTASKGRGIRDPLRSRRNKKSRMLTVSCISICFERKHVTGHGSDTLLVIGGTPHNSSFLPLHCQYGKFRYAPFLLLLQDQCCSHHWLESWSRAHTFVPSSPTATQLFLRVQPRL
jgi:hypothetical protein